MRIAVTGHMDVSPGSVDLIRKEVLNHLERIDPATPVIGITCLARGADSIFAEAIVSRGAGLEVVLPSPSYRDKKVKPDHAPAFDRLVAAADYVRTLPYAEVNKEAYEAANEVLVKMCDRLYAIWDGESGRRSGTATVVDLARSRSVPVTVIWPDGAARG